MFSTHREILEAAYKDKKTNEKLKKAGSVQETYMILAEFAKKRNLKIEGIKS